MAMTIANTTFAAISFAGAGFLFKSFDGGKYGDEMKRHNLAMENLARARDRWNENEIKQRDKIQRLRAELSDANKNINDTNAALSLLRKVTYKGRTFRREPELNDYYKPSPEMEKYKLLAEGIMGVGIGWVGYKTYKYLNKSKN